jgi:hypothetical protein
MRKSLLSVILCAVLCISLFGCAQSKVINGTEYEPKGIVTADEKDKSIRYKASVGNVVWSVLLSGTIVVPVILCGWYLWEPVSVK